ncbi:MAG: methylmalonyl Co-A mutase-associated GTPase MeaB, partial [Bdellovibrionales bacterium]|nr:methylmalonyl Co-A mutase-associated GTPase MeaB [Bdellovibrionales bacterium]
NGDRRALAQAITLLESKLAPDYMAAQQIIQELYPKTGKALRIGITGIPGVGKSTLIEAFGTYLLREQGARVAVLTVDPSSKLHGGSILGDKTRMAQLAADPNAFIRPTPAKGFLGGVGHHTRETILLCEAAGFDHILVESVGVGQSEFQLLDMVDFFLLLSMPHEGDEIQGIKKGILEVVNAIFVNKADGKLLNAAKNHQQMLQNSLHFSHKDNDTENTWLPPVHMGSALNREGVDTLFQTIKRFTLKSKESGKWIEKREKQTRVWMEEQLRDQLYFHFKQKYDLKKMAKSLNENELTPYFQIKQLISSLEH